MVILKNSELLINNITEVSATNVILNKAYDANLLILEVVGDEDLDGLTISPTGTINPSNSTLDANLAIKKSSDLSVISSIVSAGLYTIDISGMYKINLNASAITAGHVSVYYTLIKQ